MNTIKLKLFAIFCSVILFCVCQSLSNINCGSLIKSTCNDVETTKWNRKNVTFHIKEWFRSIDIIDRGLQTQESHKKHFLAKKFRRDFDFPRITYISNFDCNRKKTIGPVWKTPTGTLIKKMQFHNGFLYGLEDSNGRLSGNDIAYIYPDMKTVLKGNFENGVMKGARKSKIIGERCHKGIKEIKVAKPKEGSPVLRYSRPNMIRIATLPKVMDALDRRNIYIKEGPWGDGVFAKRDFVSGEIIAYYSGLLWEPQDLFPSNLTLEERSSIHKMLMRFNETMYFHIPKPYWNVSDYRATLGHKVNHSFKGKDVKAMFKHAFHPVFGNIGSVMATKRIKKGEEVLVDYQYQPGSWVPEWYSSLYLKEFGKPWSRSAKRIPNV